jgi:hypothetical protein
MHRAGYLAVGKSESARQHEGDLKKEMKRAMRDLVEQEHDKKSKTIVYPISTMSELLTLFYRPLNII